MFEQGKNEKDGLQDLESSERIGAVHYHPSDMCETDKIMLYALVRGLRPLNALEIGSRWGGSAKIITNSMEDNRVGKLPRESRLICPYLKKIPSTEN